MIIRPEAEADLVDARNWYAEQRKGLGAEFLLCVVLGIFHTHRDPRGWQSRT